MNVYARTRPVTLIQVFLGFCLMATVLQPVSAANKVKIEIVASGSRMYMVGSTIPGRPEQAELHCRRNAAADTLDCKSTTERATDPTQGKRPHFTFFADAVLPDGSHALLECIGGFDKDCAGIPPVAPEKSSSPTCETVGEVETCTEKNPGVYETKRDKNDILIYGPKGKLRYRIVGSW
jgi:hypothetical protein